MRSREHEPLKLLGCECSYYRPCSYDRARRDGPKFRLISGFAQYITSWLYIITRTYCTSFIDFFSINGNGTTKRNGACAATALQLAPLVSVPVCFKHNFRFSFRAHTVFFFFLQSQWVCGQFSNVLYTGAVSV